MMRLRFFYLLCCIILFYCTVHAGEMRQWTGSNGKVIEAEFLGLDGDVVKIRLKTGREMNVLLSKFAEKDQAIIKRITSTEDPFADVSNEQRKDDDSVLRISLDVSAQGQAKYRLERATVKPDNNFEGRKLNLAGYPGADIRAGKNGETKIVFDFEQCKKPIKMNRWNDKTDAVEDGLLRFFPEEGDKGKVLFSFPSVTTLPLHIVCDVKEIAGECCYIEFFMVGEKDSQKMGVFQVVCDGESLDDNFSIYFRYGISKPDVPEDERWAFSEVLQKKDLTLDVPIEGAFRIPAESKKQFERLLLGFGKNLNRLKDAPVDWSPIGISRIEVIGKNLP